MEAGKDGITGMAHRRAYLLSCRPILGLPTREVSPMATLEVELIRFHFSHLASLLSET